MRFDIRTQFRRAGEFVAIAIHEDLPLHVRVTDRRDISVRLGTAGQQTYDTIDWIALRFRGDRRLHRAGQIV